MIFLTCCFRILNRFISVSVDIKNPDTFEREINLLAEGMEFIGIEKSILITKEREGSMNVGNKLINFIPLWKWLLTYD